MALRMRRVNQTIRTRLTGMQLTRAADYAVRVMIHLAGAAPGTRASRTDLAGAVEGPIRLNTCLNGQNECGQASWCPAYPVWNEAQRAMTAVLRSATIDDLARQAALNRPTDAVKLDEPPWN